MKTRAKFRCNSVNDFGTCKNISLSAVCDDGTPENERFHKYTPTGKVEITVDNPDVIFKPGSFYYVDFTSIEEK